MPRILSVPRTEISAVERARVTVRSNPLNRQTFVQIRVEFRRRRQTGRGGDRRAGNYRRNTGTDMSTVTRKGLAHWNVHRGGTVLRPRPEGRRCPGASTLRLQSSWQVLQAGVKGTRRATVVQSGTPEPRLMRRRLGEREYLLPIRVRRGT